LEAHSNPEIETPQWALDLQNLMNEEDVFKLSIRGQAAIDELLSHGIAEAFGGAIPPELRRMPFPTRVALAIALGIGVEHIRGALLANAKVRHDFAHGHIHELSLERATAVARELEEPAPNLVEAITDGDLPPDPRMIHRVIISVLYASIQFAIEQARDRRTQQEDAMLAFNQQMLGQIVHQGRPSE